MGQEERNGYPAEETKSQEQYWDCCNTPDVMPYRGIYVCRNCGVVHGPVIIDAPRRAFTKQEIEERRSSEPVFTDFGPRTVVPKSGIDTTGSALSPKQKQKYWRLSKIQRSVTTTFERNLSIAQPKLLNQASTLGLPRTVTEEALRIYKKAVRAKLTMGRSIDSLVAASLYAAIKIHGLPRTLNELSKVTQIPVKTIAKSYRLLAQHIEESVPKELSDLKTQYIVRFGQDLKLSPAVQKRAIELLNQAEQSGMVLTGKNPKGLASAALYLAAKELGEPRSQFEISKTSAISEVTLRNRAKQIKKMVAKASS
ncbi:MAG: transcription initiation factor IIB [Candidatus Helarchaeota archaeon]|nr:transcription initiation factor IIB [Candidatus Helarchaeota archaeon]